MSRARDLANLGNNASGLETLTVSDITDLSVSASNINSATNQITDSSTDLNVDSNTLVVDKSANAVGIGTTSPDANSSLHINSTGYHPLVVNTTSAGGGGMILQHSGTYRGHVGTAGSTHLSNSSTDDILIRAQNELIFASNGNNERIRINSGGILKLVNSNYIDLQNAGTNYAYIGRGSDLTTSASATDLSLRFDGSNFYLSADATPRMKVTSDGDVTINSGSLIIGTAGKGIDFSADGEAGSGTPHQIFDDYEFGEWNPTENNGVALTNNSTPRYIKIGKQVVLYFDVTVASNTNGNAFDLSNFPYAMGYSEHAPYGGFVTHSNYSSSEIRLNLSTNTRATFYIGTSAILLSQASTYRFAGQIHFLTSD